MTAPDRIFLSPTDAELFGQKYGHPGVEWVEPHEPAVEYVLDDLEWSDYGRDPKAAAWTMIVIGLAVIAFWGMVIWGVLEWRDWI